MFSGHWMGRQEVEMTPPPWLPISPKPQKLRSKWGWSPQHQRLHGHLSVTMTIRLAFMRSPRQFE